ncbi:MAG TPA: hypothetical protein VFP61_10475 [Acidimicrobiales bacterium]|nr:hypothetical protein [Acidimicrobiales bacterium]
MTDAWPDDWIGPWWLQRRRAGASGPTACTPVGSLAGPERLLVDPRGYLGADGCTWGVDWWVGADDRWHAPANDAAVRQALLGSAPVVQTSLRVPGGDVHARVGAVAVGDGTTRAVVEVHNDSPAPAALALALRPATTQATGRLAEVALRGSVVTVGGVAAVVLPGRPSLAWAGDRSAGDPFAAVAGGAATPPGDAVEVTCAQGMAALVIVVPLAHRATYRWQLALSEVVAAAARDSGRRRRRLPGVGAPAAAVPASVPRSVTAPELAAVARGWTAQTERLVDLALPEVAALAPADAIRSHLLLALGVERPHPEVALAGATAGLGVRAPALVLGDAVAGATAEGCAAGLVAADRLVGLGGAVPDPRAVRAAAEVLLAAWADAPGAVPPPQGARAAARLLARAGESRAAERLHAAADRLGSGRPAPRASGDPAAVAAAAVAAAADGDPGWLDHLGVLTASASPTVTWPDAAAGIGCDPVVTARWWLALRDALLGDTDAGTVALLPAWSPALGRAPVEAHRLPSAAGLVSFALRWHDDRPALLWEVDGGPDGTVVRAPALDPSWRGSRRGEALLAAPVTPSEESPDPR